MDPASPTRKRRREEEPPLPGKKKKVACAAKGCSMGRVTGMPRCSSHVARCMGCDMPIARGKVCAPCRERATASRKACSRPGCEQPRLPRLRECLAHTLHCRTCKKPMKRGKKCAHCAKPVAREWKHEAWARQIIEFVFWPNRAPPCKKCRRPKLCAKCKSIESCRVHYHDKGQKRNRWFDFDIVIKVPVMRQGVHALDKKGVPMYRIIVVIEVDGPSHYKPIKFGKAKSNIADQRRRDAMKHEYCRKKNIFLARIPCYFARKVKNKVRMVPNKPKFIKLVHRVVREIYERMRAGMLGTEASKLLTRHWDANWASHPMANP